MTTINPAASGGTQAFLAKDICGPQSAVFVEGDRINRRQRIAGVYDAQGEPLPYCDIKGDYLNAAPAGPIAAPPEAMVIDGPVLFAGLACEQFGHVILNSLGRLWALEHLPRETTLLFHARSRVLRRYYKFIRPLLNLLGINNPFVISRNPVRSKEFYTAAELFGERYDGFGDPAFFEWLDSRLPSPGQVDPDKRVYVTRSQLGVEAGRYACEDHFERLLEKQGYDVFAPEKHDLQTQIDVLGTAGRLISAPASFSGARNCRS
jgi:capsular polysaccharide biosynthesis protein